MMRSSKERSTSTLFLVYLQTPWHIFLFQNHRHRVGFYETMDHSGHVGRNRIKKFQVHVICEHGELVASPKKVIPEFREDDNIY